jgi:glycosyltransferase involved in cell wall biosynthesis
MRRPAPQRRRVCIVRQMRDYEPQVQRVAEALVGAGFDVEVLCMRHPDRPRKVVVNGVKVTSLPASLGRSGKVRYALDYGWFFLLAAGTLALRSLRRPCAAVQVYSMPDFLVFAAAVPKLRGSRVVAYMNEPSPELFETLYGSPRLTRTLERIEQRVLRFADHAFTVTEQLKQRFVERGASAERISVVLNAADPVAGLAGWSPPSPPPKKDFVLVCHGSVEERYGHDTILEAAELLRHELPDLRVVFTGRGSAVDDVLALIDARGLDDIVRFEGWVTPNRLNDLLHTADVGVVAQKASAYSHLVHTYKMVDYWIFGLPVIASRLRAVSTVYDDSVIEYFEPADAADLARAIRRLHDDPARREELARNGRLAHERHGWGAQREIVLAVYDALLNGSRRSPRAAGSGATA